MCSFLVRDPSLLRRGAGSAGRGPELREALRAVLATPRLPASNSTPVEHNQSASEGAGCDKPVRRASPPATIA